MMWPHLYKSVQFAEGSKQKWMIKAEEEEFVSEEGEEQVKEGADRAEEWAKEGEKQSKEEQAKEGEEKEGEQDNAFSLQMKWEQQSLTTSLSTAWQWPKQDNESHPEHCVFNCYCTVVSCV